MPIPVKAKKLGFYQDVRKRPDEEFTIESEQELGSWMERLDGVKPPVPEKVEKKK